MHGSTIHAVNWYEGNTHLLGDRTSGLLLEWLLQSCFPLWILASFLSD
jgi:hypothetical protein